VLNVDVGGRARKRLINDTIIDPFRDKSNLGKGIILEASESDLHWKWRNDEKTPLRYG